MMVRAREAKMAEFKAAHPTLAFMAGV